MSAVTVRFLTSRAFLGLGIFILLVSCKSFEVADCDDCGGKEPISNHHSHEKASPQTSPKAKPKQLAEPEKPNVAVVPAVVKVVDSSLPELKEVEKMVPLVSANQIGNETAVIKEVTKIAETKSGVLTATPAPAVKPASEIVSKDEEEKGPIQFKGDGANRIIEAKGRDVVLTGNNGVFVITGGCGQLTLTGRKNQIQCDSVSQIEIAGDGNIMILGSIGGGRIRGSGNNLSWGQGVDGFSPIVESFGTNNSMKRLE